MYRHVLCVVDLNPSLVRMPYILVTQRRCDSGWPWGVCCTGSTHPLGIPNLPWAFHYSRNCVSIATYKGSTGGGYPENELDASEPYTSRFLMADSPQNRREPGCSREPAYMWAILDEPYRLGLQLQQHRALHIPSDFTIYVHISGSSVVPFGSGHGSPKISSSLKASSCLYSADFHMGHSLCLRRNFRVISL